MAVRFDRPFFRVEGGLATLGPELLEVKSTLDQCFGDWAIRCRARAMRFSPLIRVCDLERMDYFRNFPHLCLLASPIDKERLSDEALRAGGLRNLGNSLLSCSEYALPSAACYNVYLHLVDAVLGAEAVITTEATCFRNEERFEGLARLAGFTMREFVCVGSASAVRSHLELSRRWILDFAAAVGLVLEMRAATDPFYDPASGRAVMQKLFPVKEEFVYGGTLALSSLNYHRNFFGERCNIRLEGGRLASSGCVGMGLERWIHALMERYNEDPRAIVRSLQRYLAHREV